MILTQKPYTWEKKTTGRKYTKMLTEFVSYTRVIKEILFTFLKHFFLER